MPTVSIISSVHIHVKPEEAFAYVADLSRHGEWSAWPLKVEAFSLAPGHVGSQYHSVGHMLGLALHDDLKVTDYQPSTRFGFTVKDVAGDLRHEFTFQPQAGGTLVVRTVSVAVSPLRKLFSPLIAAVGRPSNDKTLQLLKAQLEKMYAEEGQGQ
jgi:Polyketide cyclase / dehydrase and lipid transport